MEYNDGKNDDIMENTQKLRQIEISNLKTVAFR